MKVLVNTGIVFQTPSREKFVPQLSEMLGTIRRRKPLWYQNIHELFISKDLFDKLSLDLARFSSLPISSKSLNNIMAQNNLGKDFHKSYYPH